MQLTHHFNLNEFQTRTPIPQDKIPNIKLVAENLQIVRNFVGPLKISSGYRGPIHNQEVGGSPSSYHLQGLAADFSHHGSNQLLGMVLTFFMVTGLIKKGELIVYKDFCHYAPAGKLDIQWR